MISVAAKTVGMHAQSLCHYERLGGCQRGRSASAIMSAAASEPRPHRFCKGDNLCCSAGADLWLQFVVSTITLNA